VASRSSSCSRWRSEQRPQRRARSWVCSPQPGQACQGHWGQCSSRRVGRSGSRRGPASPWRNRRSILAVAGRRAAWLPGEPGDRGRSQAVADRAGHHRDWPAAGTQRPAGGADADRTASVAAQACLLVGPVGAQTAGAQWLSVLVTGSRFSVDAAARAGFGVGGGRTVAADPDSIEDLAQRDDPCATRARRPDRLLITMLSALPRRTAAQTWRLEAGVSYIVIESKRSYCLRIPLRRATKRGGPA